jgi:N4-gp56 family major capsid protein
MPGNTYQGTTGAINEVFGEMLAHAQHEEVLAMGCKQVPMPKRKGDNITYRRVLPKGATTTDVNTQNRPSVTAAAHLVQEGVTPTAEQITYQFINVVQQEYACLYMYTDKAAELHEEDIPKDQVQQTGERMGLVREMIKYGAMKACTNVIYSGGTTRATVDEKITLNALRRMTVILKANHAKKKNRAIKPGINYETFGIQPSYVVFVSTDCQADVEDLPGYVAVVRYGDARSQLHPAEIGAVGEFRFILSPELTAYADAGGANSALYGTTNSAANVDVYPYLLMGEDAVFDVALRGMDSMEPVHLSHKQKDKSDVLGQRGYVGAIFWNAVAVVNGGWMGVIEAGRSNLT